MSHWEWFWLGVYFFTALTTPVTAAITAFIAYQQWKTNRRQSAISRRQSLTSHRQLMLNLFDKRFAVYDAVKHIVDNPDLKPDEYHAHRLAILQADFILPATVTRTMHDLLAKVREWRSVQRQLEPVDPRRTIADEGQRIALDEKQIELEKWMLETEIQLVEEFKPFLDFTNIK